MATICFAVVAFFAMTYALKITYYGIIYLALGCNHSFNKAITAAKTFIENEWKE